MEWELIHFKKYVKEITDAAAVSENYIGTDPDREGEAIVASCEILQSKKLLKEKNRKGCF